jgi:TPP-dependent 2-oxoacid decarboxylase
MSAPDPLHSERPDVVSVATYLATRLQQLDVGHLFGLPGDFNLGLIDELLASSDLEWVGTTNELNAAYAADGYARKRGLGVVLTTFGVGELSAINGVAGSYAESVPVLQITGSPATEVMASRSLAHHTLVDGDFDHFRRAYQQVTVAAETLRARESSHQIDTVLTAMLATSKPGYLSIPADVVTCLVSAEPLARPLTGLPSDPRALADFRRAALHYLSDRGGATVLAGHLLKRRKLDAVVEALAEVESVTVASSLGGQTMADGAVYIGGLTQDEVVRRAVEESDALIVAGVVFSDITSGMFTHHIDPERCIVLDLCQASVGESTFSDVGLSDTLGVIADLLGAGPTRQLDVVNGHRARLESCRAANTTPMSEPVAADAAPALTHAELWPALEWWIPSGTTVLADAGTAYYGAAGMHLAPGCELVGQPIWSSIGYTMPALLGIELAEPGRRPVLLIGDGAAQLTIQELATILHRHLDVVIIVLNNGGYTIERRIRSPEAVYQDITPWQWTSLPAALGQGATSTAVAEDLEQLGAALAAADQRPGPVLIEVRLGRDDAPPILAELARQLHHAPVPAEPPADLRRSA